MMRHEFEALTGIYVTNDLYAAIEAAYYDFDGDKAAFCKAYKKNLDGLASNIQMNVDMAEHREAQTRAAEVKELRAEIERLKKALEVEQEWEPFEYKGRVGEADYREGRRGADTLSDEAAKEYIAREFGFDLSKITIHHEVDVLEVDRHGAVRKTGRKYERIPYYGATDWNYARFDVANWAYEVYNGSLCHY